MDRKRLKEEMMQLWMDIFHDSPDYVRIVFDTYFTPENVVCRLDGDRLVAAMLGVPYTFGSAFGSLRGMYLCGLSTLPEYRGRGIMTEMMEEMQKRAAERGFAFTFLIPADEGLRCFYADRGYSPAMWRTRSRFTSVHNFYRDYVRFLKEGNSRLNFVRLRYFERLSVKRLVYADSENSESDCDKIDMKNSDISVAVITTPEGIESISETDISNISNNTIILPRDIVENSIISEVINSDDISKKDNKLSHISNKNINPEYIELFDKKILENKDCEIAENIRNIHFINDVFEYIAGVETSGESLEMLHSYKDFIAVIRENNLSNGCVLVATTPRNDVTGILFSVPGADDDTILIPRMICSDRCSVFKLLYELGKIYPRRRMVIDNAPKAFAHKVLTDVYFESTLSDVAPSDVPAVGYAERVKDLSDCSEMYGMARILDFRQILEFVAHSRRDAKFSILVKGENEDLLTNYKVDIGKLTITHKSEKENKNEETVVSHEQLQAMIFRRPGGEDAILTAFGLPALNVSMALLLD